MRSVNCRWLVVGLLAALAALTGCASDQETINRVQPDGAVQKSLLLSGEWYTHTTVIDTDYGSLTFVGDGDTFQKIKFEIQRDHLVARRVDEWIRGSEGSQSITGQSEQTAVVAMYPILSHFDIKREYNPVTGEEQNVIGENSVDRPWNEREFIRVDWKNNVVPDAAFSVTGGMGGIKVLPGGFWNQSEEDNDAYKARFEKNGAGELYYFDVVNKYFAEPQKITIPGQANPIDACLLILNSHKDCAPGHIWTRRGFMKVEDRDYEPSVYTSDRMEHFGFFLNQRDSYDRDYGVARKGRDRFVARHNIWQQSHKRKLDEAGNEVLMGCVSDAQCGGGGSKCDIAWAAANNKSVGACTIPHRERQVRQIAYHLSKSFAEDLVDDAFDLVASWDETFRGTVAALRRIECTETKGTDCKKFTPDSTEPVFVACHNPVAEGDSKACGGAGTSAEIGDLRYNMIGWVNEPQTTSPLGFGPSFTDPMTGEILQAQAFVYGAPLETLTAQARDIVAMLNGDLDPLALQDDSEYQDWINTLGEQADRQANATREADYHVIPIDGEDAAWVNASMNDSWVKDRMKAKLGQLPVAQSEEERVLQFNAIKKALGSIGEDMALAQKGRANIEKLKGTEVEQLMINDETYLAAGMAPPSLFPGQRLTPEQMDQYSPLRGRSAAGMDQLRDARRMLSLNRQHCMLDTDFADTGMLGLVKAIDKAAKSGGTVEWYGKKYKVSDKDGIDYDLVRQMLRHPIFHAVTAHEVGHTLGLRHNFAGSFDAVNYDQKYWDLRDDGKMQGRAWDPLTTQEINGRIREYQYSTVMDYGVNFVVTDSNGVGHYDHAAIKMGYGDLSEVFTKVPASNVQTIASLVTQVTSGAIGTLDPSFARTGNLRMIPYTDWPSLVGGVKNLSERTEVRYTSLKNVTSQLFGSTEPAITADGKMPVVPYNYCGDEFADFQPDCLRYDAGADPYETLQSVIDSYWEYYPLSHFMRQRIGFDPDSIAVRTQSRFFAKLETAHRIYSFYRNIFATLPTGGDLNAFLEGPEGLGAYTLGARASFDLFRQVIATPEPTRYTQTTRPDGTTALTQGGATQFDPTIDSFNGRFLRAGYDFGPDFSWLFFSRAGYFHDKRLAVETLTKAENQFVGQDTDTDARQFAVSYYTTFPNEMNEVLRGMIANDWRSFAPRQSAGLDLTYPRGEDVLKRGVDMAGTMVDPNFGFSLQVTTMAFAASYVPRSFTQDFINKARVFAKGSAQSIILTVPTVEWNDKRSGITYVSPSYIDANGQETGIGASMLAWAKLLEDKGMNEELADWIDNIDIMRYITSVMGDGQHPFP